MICKIWWIYKNTLTHTGETESVREKFGHIFPNYPLLPQCEGLFCSLLMQPSHTTHTHTDHTFSLPHTNTHTDQAYTHGESALFCLLGLHVQQPPVSPYLMQSAGGEASSCLENSRSAYNCNVSGPVWAVQIYVLIPNSFQKKVSSFGLRGKTLKWVPRRSDSESYGYVKL